MIIITGAAGTLGQELLRLNWSMDVKGLTRNDVDLADEKSVRNLTQLKPHIIINTAAWTDVLHSESERKKAWQDTALSTIHLANFCSRNNVRLVQVSTSYVFSGDKGTPYEVDDVPGPVNYYSFCKSVAEGATRAVPNHLVIRLLFKPRRWPHSGIVADQYLTHCYPDEAARFIKEISVTNRTGIVHYGERDIIPWDFAKDTRPDAVPIYLKDLPISLPKDVRLRRSMD